MMAKEYWAKEFEATNGANTSSKAFLAGFTTALSLVSMLLTEIDHAKLAILVGAIGTSKVDENGKIVSSL